LVPSTDRVLLALWPRFWEAAMTRSIPLLVAVLVVVSSSYCDAQQSCLDIAHSKLAVGSKIKIYPVNGERFSATLESIDLQTGFLNVILAESDKGRQEGQGASGSEPSVMSVEVTEISKITYRKMGTPQAGWILGGTLAGGLFACTRHEDHQVRATQ